MRKYIEHMRERPTHERRRFSMSVAAAFTLAIFLIWLSTLGVRLAGTISGGGLGSSVNASGLVAATADVGSSLGTQLGNIQAAFSAVAQSASTSSATSAAPATALLGVPVDQAAPAGEGSTGSFSNTASGSYGSNY